MERHDLERIRFVTRHYGELKGLASKVPHGLFLIGAFGSLHGGLFAGAFVGLAFLLGTLFFWSYAEAYYSRRFGYVEHVRARSPVSSYVLDGPPLRSIAIVSAAAMLGMVLMAFAAVFSHSIVCVAWGCILLGSWLRRRCPALLGYYPIFGALLLGLAARSFSFPLDSHPYFVIRNEVASGAVLVVVGLLDHWQLVRALKPVADAERAVLEEEESR
jgi:hypothetical protein